MRYTLFILCFVLSLDAGNVQINKNGYLVYCPCYGLLGEQLQQFLDAISFAKGLSRTLVVPQFVEIRWNTMTRLHPYSKFFDFKKLQSLGFPVISIKEFTENVASKVWPEHQRYGFCQALHSGSCRLDEVYHGDFWRENKVNFSHNILQFTQFWGVEFVWHVRRNYKQWIYPAEKYPVLAFKVAPDRNDEFASRIEEAQKVMDFQPAIKHAVKAYRKEKQLYGLGTVSTILLNSKSLHDWCQHEKSYRFGEFFAIAQCTGLNKHWSHRNRNLTYDMCNPSIDTIVLNLTNVLLSKPHLRALFISTDYKDKGVEGDSLHIKNVINALRKTHPKLKKLRIVVRYTYGDYSRWIFNLALMRTSIYFVGNCVDSYSSFVRRDFVLAKKDYIFYSNTTVLPSRYNS